MREQRLGGEGREGEREGRERKRKRETESPPIHHQVLQVT